MYLENFKSELHQIFVAPSARSSSGGVAIVMYIGLLPVLRITLRCHIMGPMAR